jgi:hypothetical protein
MPRVLRMIAWLVALLICMLFWLSVGAIIGQFLQ